MKTAIIFIEEKTEEGIRDWMRLNDVNSVSEAIEALVEKGIHAYYKEGRGFIKDIDNRQKFKFWVCPNGCRAFVDWANDKATYRKCKTNNEKQP